MLRTSSPQKRFPRTFPGDGRPQRLLSFLALHCGLGVAIGIVFAAAVVLVNLGGIKDLLESSSEPFIPMLLFFASCALTFGSVVMGAAVMMLPLEPVEANDLGDDGGDKPPADADGSTSTSSTRLLGRRE